MAATSNAEALGSALAGLGDAVRSKAGASGAMTIAEMTAAIGGIEAGGGGGPDAADLLVTREISAVPQDAADAVSTIGGYAFRSCPALSKAEFPAAAAAGRYAFANCTSLSEASFPAATEVGTSAFMSCTALARACFPAATAIESNAFSGCASLSEASFPAATRIGAGAFKGCTALSEASFPAATSIGESAFHTCECLTSLYLLGSSVPALSSVDAFQESPLYDRSFWGAWGSIYVRESLYDAFLAAENWSDASIAARIAPLTDAQIAALG